MLEQQLGVAFWGHIAYSYLLVAVGAFLLVRMSFRTNQLFRSQATALLVAMFVPMAANALTVFQILPAGFDLTSVGFVFSGIVIAAAIFQGELLELAPVTRDLGREAVIDELDDRVVIVDEADRVVDVNPAAAEFVEANEETLVGQPLSALLPELADALDGDGGDQFVIELDREDGSRYYDVRVSSLYRAYGTVTGRLISLRDVTETRQREQRLDVLNRLLRHNLRNEMNVVRGNAELLESEVEGDARSRVERIKETVDTLMTRSDKVGQLSRTLEEEQRQPLSVERQVENVVRDVQTVHPEASIETDVDAGLWVEAGYSLAHAIEELVENAIIHNDGDPNVSVSARQEGSGYVEIRVEDDGPGIDEQERATIEAGKETPLQHGSGVGLWLVNWVVRKYGGTVSFEDGDGCTVLVRLPSTDEPNESESPE
jgi:PAS domain S-box-containing protein